MTVTNERADERSTDPARGALRATVRRATTSSRVFTVVAAAIVAWLVVLTRGDSAATHNKLVELCVLVVLASMWNLLAGYSGLVSIGQQAFVGIGAYTLIVFGNGFDQDIYFSVLPAGVVALLLAVPIGLVAFRLRGAYFAVGTWVIAEVCKLLITNNNGDVIRGGSGTSLEAPTSLYPPLERSQTTSLIAVGLAVTAVLAVYLVLRSRLGLSLQAIRDDEAGARGLGTDVYRSRFAVWLLAAAFTGFAGAVNYLQALRVQPESAFSVAQWTAPIIVMVVFGGIGTIEGPIIGAVAWYLLRDELTDESNAISITTETYLIASGVVAMLCAMYLRRGIWGSLVHRFPQLQLFPLRRRLDVEVPGASSTTPEEHTA
jgi:branched-chain amino acid transport system permease protein